MANVTSALKSKPVDSPAWRMLRALLIAAMIAAVCAVVVKATSKKVRDLTPDELREQMEAGKVPLDTLITTLNHMEMEDRRSVMQSPEAQKFFQALPAASRKRLVIETLDRGIRQQIERFHNMPSAERESFIAEVRQRQIEEREKFMQLPKEERDKRRKMMEDSNFEQIVEKAMQAYLSVSTSAERAELAPLYEGALDNVRFIRGEQRAP